MAVCTKCGEHNADRARFCQACGNALVAPPSIPTATEEVRQIERPTEERKTVTVVFCDLTGSTALGEKMDPESLRRVITRYFGEMRNELQRHGGTVEKFIGDAVMAVFGVPIIHEDDALRAVNAAAHMQKRMEEMNVNLELEWGVGLQARIGVNTGEVIAGDASQGHGFVSGDAVNVAARLEQAAPSGQILLGETTYRLVRDAVNVEAVAPLELKGKSEPMPAFRLVEILPDVDGTSRRLDSPLIGREEELGVIKSTFAEALATGACRLATVFGAAGSGKSRVTAEFINTLDGDVRTMRGRCLPYGEGITFYPVAEAVRGLCGVVQDDSPEVARAKVAELLPTGEETKLIAQRIFGAMGLSDTAVDAQETFWAVRMFLETIARETPLVVIFDDIHWAEPTMLDLLEYLLGFSSSAPIFVLCLARRELLDTRPSWASDSATVFLEPLTGDEVEGLISHLLGDARLPEIAQRRIVEAAEGNPLYVEEIVRMLIDDGKLTKDNGRWKPVDDLSDIAIPPTINALLAARLDRLGSEEKEVLQHASVIGKTFWWGAVSTLSAEELKSRIARHLQALVRKELIGPDQTEFAGEDAYRFSHILVRDAAYRGLPKEHRADLHEEFAQWLLAKAGDRVVEFEEILGYHYEQAAKLRQDLGYADERTERLALEAARYLGESGHRASARADMAAAANLLGRATGLLPIQDRRRMDLSIELSDALMEIGDVKSAEELLEQILRVAGVMNDPGLHARATLHLCLLRSFTESESWKEDAVRTQELIPQLEAADDQLALTRAYRLLAEVHWDDHDYGDTEKALEKALEHARKTGQQQEVATVLSFLAASTFYGPTHVHQAIMRLEQLIELSDGSPTVAANCLLRIGGLAAMQRQFDQARLLVAKSRGIYQELGLATREAAGSQETGLIELLAGDAVAAEVEFQAGYQALVDMGQEAFAGTNAAWLALALYLQGRYDDAEHYARISEQAAADEDMLKPEWAPTLARVMGRKGDLGGAETLARETVQIAEKTDDVLARGDAATALAEVLVIAGRPAEAVPLLEHAIKVYEAKGILPYVDGSQAFLQRLTG
ncbi:MAG: ATP-binding protein [Actinomycetota bacterium]